MTLAAARGLTVTPHSYRRGYRPAMREPGGATGRANRPAKGQLAMGDSVVCPKCGTAYPWDIASLMFRRNSDTRLRIRNRGHRAQCIPCQQTRDDLRKRLRRSIRKAHSTIGHHAKRYQMAKRDFERKYGWSAERVAHDIEHAFENTCCYCQIPYGGMAHGLADVTIDIIDPSKAPFYSTNTRPCCMTCNRAKHDMSPEDWAKRLIGWRLWRERQEIGPRQLGFNL